MWLFYYFNFERNYDVLKSKSPCILLNKNINFNKNETESKMKIPYIVLDKQALCFSSYKNRKLKIKLYKRYNEKGIFFVLFILSGGNFFNICFISMYGLLNTLVEYTYFYISKNITSYTFLLHFKIMESLKCIRKFA